MNRECKGIIFTLNILVSALLTEILVRYGFWEMKGIRLIIVIVAGFVFIFRALEDIEEAILERGQRHGKSGKGKSSKGSVPGIPWYKNRLPKVKQEDRDSRVYVKKVQKEAREHNTGSAVANR